MLALTPIQSSVCLFCGSDLHAETDCSLKAKAREVRDKEAKDQEAPRTDKSSSKEILIIDDPVYFPLSSKVSYFQSLFSLRYSDLLALFQKSVTFEKTDEVKEAKEAKRKRKVRLLAFSQVPGLILNFAQAEKAESRAAAEVRPFFRYSQVLSYPSQKGEADASTTRKRRRSARHAPQVGAEQEIAIPGKNQSLALLLFAYFLVSYC